MNLQRRAIRAMSGRAHHFFVALAIVLIGSPVGAQAPIAITSPADGTLVNPGQALTVTVTSPAGASITGAFVTGVTGASDLVTSLPAQFSLTVPNDTVPGIHLIGAIANTTANAVLSDEISLDVEPSEPPYALRSRLPQFLFGAPGESDDIRTLATFNDGTVVDVSDSTRLSYVSSDPTVATVDSYGHVTAVAVGNASITVTYGPPEQNVRMVVPAHVPAAPFAVAPLNVDFGSVALGGAAPRTLTLTNTTHATLKIGRIAASGDYSDESDTCARTALAPNATCTITVRFSPTTVGARPGTVQVTTNVNYVPVAISVTGTGQ